MKRSPLYRKTPLRRTRMQRSGRRSRYARRKRETPYMMWCKTLPCVCIDLNVGPCEGVVEADHAGQRGLGMKASDWTVIPICTLHHRQRTDFANAFRAWTKEMMRELLTREIANTQRLGRLAGFDVPMS